MGASGSVSSNDTPDWIAALYTIGLKLEPGCRIAWVIRLNFESPKSRPPTMARMLPVFASITSAPPCRYGVSVRSGLSSERFSM